MEAVSEEHKAKLHDHLYQAGACKGPREMMEKPAAYGAQAPTTGSQRQSQPHQKAAAAKVSMSVLASTAATATRTHDATDAAVRLNAELKNGCVAVVNYNQIGVLEMAAEYSLVQCQAIRHDRSYDCTLDSGSCLNLIHSVTGAL